MVHEEGTTPKDCWLAIEQHGRAGRKSVCFGLIDVLYSAKYSGIILQLFVYHAKGGPRKAGGQKPRGTPQIGNFWRSMRGVPSRHGMNSCSKSLRMTRYSL